MGYKVQWADDDFDDEDPTFATETEAEAYAADQINNYHVGGEVLHLSNPGDYPEGDDDDPEYEVIEVED